MLLCNLCSSFFFTRLPNSQTSNVGAANRLAPTCRPYATVELFLLVLCLNANELCISHPKLGSIASKVRMHLWSSKLSVEIWNFRFQDERVELIILSDCLILAPCFKAKLFILFRKPDVAREFQVLENTFQSCLLEIVRADTWLHNNRLPATKDLSPDLPRNPPWTGRKNKGGERKLVSILITCTCRLSLCSSPSFRAWGSRCLLAMGRKYQQFFISTSYSSCQPNLWIYYHR